MKANTNKSWHNIGKLDRELFQEPPGVEWIVTNMQVHACAGWSTHHGFSTDDDQWVAEYVRKVSQSLLSPPTFFTCTLDTSTTLRNTTLNTVPDWVFYAISPLSELKIWGSFSKEIDLNLCRPLVIHLNCLLTTIKTWWE